MLLIVTALYAEADPLIDYFGMKREHGPGAFTRYRSDHAELVISGIGKLNAAMATAWLGAYHGSAKPVWMNVGMAGHASIPTGEVRWINRIEDLATGYRWYPFRPARLEMADESITTADRPQEHYPENGLVDMEASGFMPAATRFTSMELIHVCKVVSDNRDSPARQLHRQEVHKLIEPHVPGIASLWHQLSTLATSLDHPADRTGEIILGMQRFTVSQKHQLRRLVSQYHTLFPERDLLDEIRQADPRSASEILTMLSGTVVSAGQRF